MGVTDFPRIKPLRLGMTDYERAQLRLHCYNDAMRIKLTTKDQSSYYDKKTVKEIAEEIETFIFKQ